MLGSSSSAASSRRNRQQQVTFFAWTIITTRRGSGKVRGELDLGETHATQHFGMVVAFFVQNLFDATATVETELRERHLVTKSLGVVL